MRGCHERFARRPGAVVLCLTLALLLSGAGLSLAQDEELVEAFAFGSRLLDCPTYNEPGVSYTIVHHAGNDQASHDAIAYDEARGWGYEVLYPDPADQPYGPRNGGGQFGPFDESPNGRTAFPDTCPAELYDSFIGAKNFLQTCDELVVGDRESPCTEGGLTPEGIIFRIDLEPGMYRFVAAVGSADNRHASRILVENGGDGLPENISDDHVVLVSNWDQAEHGAGNFATVGFNCKIPPPASGPRFTMMDEDGLPTDGAPSSPLLEVTEGYIRLHQLQANSNAGAAGARDPNGGNMVILEIWRVDGFNDGEAGAAVARAIAPAPYSPGDIVTVTLSASDVSAPTTIVETIPAGVTVDDPGGGVVAGETITFTLRADGEVVYSLQTPDDTCGPLSFSGSVETQGACASAVSGTEQIGCVPLPVVCEPEDEDAELVAAFSFGVQEPCAVSNDPGFGEYTIVEHLSPEGVAYDAGRGWGYEILVEGDVSRGGYGQFGPFDDSPNNRNRFLDLCPEELYDSFIGAKDFAMPCNEGVVGAPDEPCIEGGIPEQGIIFRVDLDPGFYRFVAVVGEADNPHAHRLLAEDGGEGPSSEIANPFVTLVNNFDQNQQTTGQVRADCLGCGVFAAVGFGERQPPAGDGIAPDPQFVSMDEDGLASLECPSSPVLEVNEGYIRFHQLQGNANLGPGSRSNGTAVDANGGDLVLLEIWRVEGGVDPSPVFKRGDADGNGVLQLTDAVFTLGWLFQGGPTPACLDAADSDDNGVVQLTDAVRTLGFLFQGGAPPPAPGPSTCGVDPTADGIDCASYTRC